MPHEKLFVKRHASFLNNAGEHSDASIMGEIVVERWHSHDDDHPDEQEPSYSAHLLIRDCSRRISLELDIVTDAEFANSCAKLQRLTDTIHEMQRNLVEARGVFLNARTAARNAESHRKAKEEAAKPTTVADTHEQPAPPRFTDKDAARLDTLAYRARAFGLTASNKYELDALVAKREAWTAYVFRNLPENTTNVVDDARALHDPGNDRAKHGDTNYPDGNGPTVEPFFRGPPPE